MYAITREGIAVTRRVWFVVAALIGIFWLQSFTASRTKSPVFDEPPHIASGLSYLAGSVFYANPQHPPLLKELSAFSLARAGVVWPDSPAARSLIQGAPEGAGNEWPIGNTVIAANPDRVMFWARLPFIILAGALGVLLYCWGRAMLGPAAALGALVLYALDPTVIGHSFLVTTDVGVTTFTVLFLFALWLYIQRPHWARLSLCGVALGLALGAKFSAVLLIPIAAVLLAVNAQWPAAHSPQQKGATSGITGAVLAFAAMCAIAIVVVEALYFFPHNPWLYLEGFGKINADHIAGHQAFFNGELADRFYSYFMAAYLLKEPLASIALAAGGLIVLTRSSTMPVLTRVFLLLPPALFVATVTFKADDLGVRYIMPALPFAYLLGGLALAALVKSAHAWGRPTAAILCAWLAVEAAGIYPDHLSYFNEAACLLTNPAEIGFDGGSRCGPLWLDDSNVDWGQSVKQLDAWTKHNANGRPLKLVYFGSFPPEHYGLAYEAVEPQAVMTRPAPGLYAVSGVWYGRVPAVLNATAPGATSWMRETAPIAIVGHAFYIFDVK